MTLVKKTKRFVKFQEEGAENFMYISIANWYADGCPEAYWVEVTPE